MNNLIQSVQQNPLFKTTIAARFGRHTLLFVAVCHSSIMLASAGLAQTCRDGCYGTNTYQGVDALPSESVGADNTALGYIALTAYPDYSTNTAAGALTLAPGSTT